MGQQKFRVQVLPCHAHVCTLVNKASQGGWVSLCDDHINLHPSLEKQELLTNIQENTWPVVKAVTSTQHTEALNKYWLGKSWIME